MSIMKIGFIASLRGKEYYSKEYTQILDYLTRKGHKVEHIMHLWEKDVLSMSSIDREKFLYDFYHRLLDMDLIIAECSFASINVGYGISFLVHHGRPVVALYKEGSKQSDYHMSLPIGSHSVFLHQYNDGDLLRTVDYALQTIDMHVDKRFTIIFPAHLLARVEDMAKSKKISKAVYIRHLVEKDLASHHH